MIELTYANARVNFHHYFAYAFWAYSNRHLHDPNFGPDFDLEIHSVRNVPIRQLAKLLGRRARSSSEKLLGTLTALSPCSQLLLVRSFLPIDALR